MKTKFILDRIEGNKAVLLSKNAQESYIISLALLPQEAREGDVLEISVDINKEVTKVKKKEISKLIDKLSKKGKDQ